MRHPPFIIDNWTTDQNGTVIGQKPGEQLCDTGGINCQNLYWNVESQQWDSPRNRFYLSPSSNEAVQQLGAWVKFEDAAQNTLLGAGLIATGASGTYAACAYLGPWACIAAAEAAPAFLVAGWQLEGIGIEELRTIFGGGSKP